MLATSWKSFPTFSELTRFRRQVIDFGKIVLSTSCQWWWKSTIGSREELYYPRRTLYSLCQWKSVPGLFIGTSFLTEFQNFFEFKTNCHYLFFIYSLQWSSFSNDDWFTSIWGICGCRIWICECRWLLAGKGQVIQRTFAARPSAISIWNARSLKLRKFCHHKLQRNLEKIRKIWENIKENWGKIWEKLRKIR